MKSTAISRTSTARPRSPATNCSFDRTTPYIASLSRGRISVVRCGLRRPAFLPGHSLLASESDEWTVRRILEWTTGYLRQHGSESPRLEAELLLSNACGWPRIQLYTHYDDQLQDDVRTKMRDLVRRRAASEPVAYLIGYREFFSLKFAVGPAVFIPRPETETLVLEALAVLKDAGEHPAERTFLDLCTGSGCVAVAIAVNAPGARGAAVEQSEETLAFARRNFETHGVAQRVELLQGDLDAPLAADRRFHVLVSNPPYVTTAEMQSLPADVRRFEPSAALEGGADGLDVVRRIARLASRRLVPGGWVMMELSPPQAEAGVEILTAAGLESATAVKDLSGAPRVIKARLPVG
ncbi:MAG: peptide chain release factor N(5)-glutamine methyltransferase [Planctomyces sp.]|nr:peptide chain release factor N(5)-glutamine methyltransferase [Planctomyces sp.]